MGYPYGDTYLEQIQKSSMECKEIENAFYVLRQKFVKDHDGYTDTMDLSISENFAVLGEAFELASSTVDGITDIYHFMWDIVDALLTPSKQEEKDDANSDV